jgi:hypothetical protein
MTKTTSENPRLKVYGNMEFDVTDQPTSFDEIPIDFKNAKALWDHDPQKNFSKIAALLNQNLRGIFMPFSINNWEELFVDEDESGMPEYLSVAIKLKKINFKKGQFIPHCGVEAIFDVPVTSAFLSHDDLLAWQEENDFFFNGLMFGWDIPRNEETEDLDFMADGHSGCECIVNFEGSI